LKIEEIRKKSTIREYAESIIIALVLALVIRTFVIQAFKIPSGSMEPTLQIGDHLLVNKFIYGVKIPFTSLNLFPWKSPQRGDVIVFIYPLEPDKDFIKRVIGVGGDTVRTVNKRLYINGVEAPDPHAVYRKNEFLQGDLQNLDNFGPVTVPKGNLFVMGDNRDRSYDSRFWGFVPLKDVLGKAFTIYWSWDSRESMVRWNRLGHLIY
jgi:signal peptidase I